MKLVVARNSVSSYIYLLRKPIHVPITGTLDISNDELETFKVQGGDGIKSHIKQNEGPLKEGVDGISYAALSDEPPMILHNHTYHRLPYVPCVE